MGIKSLLREVISSRLFGAHVGKQNYGEETNNKYKLWISLKTKDCKFYKDDAWKKLDQSK